MRPVTATLMAMLVMIINHSALSNGAISATISDGINVQKEHSIIEVLTTYTNTSLRYCVALGSTGKIKAINFLFTDDRSTFGTCTILTKTISVPSTEKPLIKSPCDPNPCHYQSKCTVVKDEDFECHCTYPVGGRTCEDLICKECHQKDNLVIFWDTSVRSMTWQQSYEYCQRRGLKLLLDKDEEKHELVQQLLSNRFPNAKDRAAFWIGLNRTSKGAPFRYTDGALLNEAHAPWALDRPHGHLCVVIASGDSFKFDWDDDDCDSIQLFPDWTYYPLCEQTYSFLAEDDPCRYPGLC